MPRRVVVLAYYFPPLAGIASERAAALSRHLKALGWDPTVISPRSGFYHRAAEADEVRVNVVRTPSAELSRLLRTAYTGERGGTRPHVGAVAPVEASRVGEVVRRFVRDFVYVPDAQVGWIPFAIMAGARATAPNLAPAVVYSTSVPYSAHLAGMAVARRPRRMPWVAEFRDPWARSERSLRRKADAALERAIVRHADHLVTTAPALRGALLAAHPELSPEKVTVITNGFEPVAEQPVPPPQEPMTILYAGTVAAGEDMAPVLAALDCLAQRHPAAFRLRVLGPPGPWQEPGEAGHGRSWLTCDGVVTPAQAREAMARSSVLLHVQRHPAYADALPGKLFEYIGARRPIVAVCPAESDMASLLRQYADVRFVKPDAPGGLIATLEQLLDEHAGGLIQQPRVPASLTAPLRRSEQAAQLASIFEAVIDRRADR